MLKTLLLSVLFFSAMAAWAGDKRTELVIYALSLADTPYSYGGAVRGEGFDCSGFVRHVFGHALGLDLPHNAGAISQTSESVDADELAPGDLVFFNTQGTDYSHVGIYLGDNRFIHASSSATGRVTISDMLSPYWRDRYNGARRVSSGGSEWP
jgi:cell wall-associated NlpC family hydrolase